jgi:hypothetical protein
MTELIRLRSMYFLFAVRPPCGMYAPRARRRSISDGTSNQALRGGLTRACGDPFAIQFNNEPPIVQVADGHGGPPILYHGREVKPEELKSVILLKRNEARERFGDQTLDYAILIESR